LVRSRLLAASAATNFRGEVVDFNLAFFQFIWECNSENIIKIGPYLPKLLQEKLGTVFLAHPVYPQLLDGFVTYKKKLNRQHRRRFADIETISKR